MKRFWIILAVLLVIAYIVSPVDALPDVFPILGWLDDAILAGLLIYYLRYRRLPGFMGRLEELLFGRKVGGGKTRYTGDEQTVPQDLPKDPYDILGIKQGASIEEIHAAYRQAAQRYHPDKVAHLGEEFKEMAGKRFVEIQQAYEALTGKKG